MSAESKAAARIAAKAAGRAVPGVGEVIMVIEGTPVAVEAIGKTGQRLKHGMSEQLEHMKKRRVKKAISTGIRTGFGTMWEGTKGVGKTAIAVLVAREAAEAAMPSGAKKNAGWDEMGGGRRGSAREGWYTDASGHWVGPPAPRTERRYFVLMYETRSGKEVDPQTGQVYHGLPSAETIEIYGRTTKEALDVLHARVRHLDYYGVKNYLVFDNAGNELDPKTGAKLNPRRGARKNTSMRTRRYAATWPMYGQYAYGNPAQADVEKLRKQYRRIRDNVRRELQFKQVDVGSVEEFDRTFDTQVREGIAGAGLAPTPENFVLFAGKLEDHFRYWLPEKENPRRAATEVNIELMADAVSRGQAIASYFKDPRSGSPVAVISYPGRRDIKLKGIEAKAMAEAHRKRMARRNPDEVLELSDNAAYDYLYSKGVRDIDPQPQHIRLDSNGSYHLHYTGWEKNRYDRYGYEVIVRDMKVVGGTRTRLASPTRKGQR